MRARSSAVSSTLVTVFWSTRDWADTIAGLPVEGALPSRTVLVPNERVAHSLRRELIRAGHPHALAGTRFLTPAVAAIEVLHGIGITFRAGEESLRMARLLALFRTGLSLRHFSLDLLRSKPGWDEAFARTVLDLEGAGLRPEHLEGPEATPRLRDVAAIWRALDASAGESWTMQRVYGEANAALERKPSLWSFFGPTLAPVTGRLTAAESRFLGAIPRLTLGLLAARPVRSHYLGRIEALFGSPAADALRSTTAPRSSRSERDLIVSYLFEPPAVLADPARPRSAGPDGTVHLEEHAGVEEEIEATADWVAQQVLDGTPLEDIAVLVPAPDPLVGLVAERLQRLPWHDGSLPVHVAGGLPLASTASGARVLAVVRALRAHLSGAALSDVLPALRTASSDGRHLSRGAATDLVWSLGTVGGGPARPSGALEWASRAVEREPDLETQLALAREAADDPEGSSLARNARDLERLLADLRAVRPALEALVGVAKLLVENAPLGVLWPALHTFLDEWLLQPGEGAPAHALLNDQLTAITAEADCHALTGDEALRVIEEAIGSIRIPVGRFGEPAIYIGSVPDAAGLGFHAVRVIGLAEGHLPPMTREDPVIPDAQRIALTPPDLEGRAAIPPTAADRALEALHAFDIALRSADARIALSAPRLDIERSQREPSSVLLEAAAALGRPDSATGERIGVIPDTVAMQRDAFLPARHAALAFRQRTPLGESAWQDGVALGVLGIPARWRGSQALDLERITALLGDEEAGPLDGILGTGAAPIAVPGLSPDWPISPSKLQTLLQCPYLFLLDTLLGFEEPASAPPLREIGQPMYGGLLHRAAEEFYRVHGLAFSARQRTLKAWHVQADTVVKRVFGEFLQQYPLIGGAVRNRQRERLRADIHDLLEYDWDKATPRQFVAVERTFGRPTPVELPLGRRSLFVRGRIDRLDVEGGRTLVRDLKSGRPHPRFGKETDPAPILDIQLAVYGLVTHLLADQWQVPSRISAAYAYIGRGADERHFHDDFHQVLEPAARKWLALAADLLGGRLFPRTSNADDCTFCRFRPVCGDNAYERAARVLADGGKALARFGEMKGLEVKN